MDGVNTQSLPLHPSWSSTEAYIESLLSFITETDLFRNLCGGVHILDFLTRQPDLYSWVLPRDWRDWVDLVDIHDFLDLLLREDLEPFISGSNTHSDLSTWREYPSPPPSLVQYIHRVRIHSLARGFEPISPTIKPLPRHVSVGMKPKKVHEVMNFAAYVDRLSATALDSEKQSLSIIDFGSGQNYLGRTLACPPYNKHVIAIEQRHHNVEGAMVRDFVAKLATKEKKMRNKKEYKRQMAVMKVMEGSEESSLTNTSQNQEIEPLNESGVQTPVVETVPEVLDAAAASSDDSSSTTKGSMTYIEQVLESGHLEHILTPNPPTPSTTNPTKPKSLVVSIHSCGNLTHHGLRSISLNPSVQAVAMIGCCYNLLTERLGPATYKHPQLRSNHPRLEATGSTYDPHGFPMSHRLETYEYDVTTVTTTTKNNTPKREKGVRLNITARMMAVQAPYNWGRTDSEQFFTRHFYRALLQRILLDRGVVKQALAPEHEHVELTRGGSLSGKDTEGTPLIVGSLRKTAFTSFHAYVRAALEKLTTGNPDADEGAAIARMTQDLLADPAVVAGYEARYAYARKHLAVIWSLMAFSAGVVESVIVVDRWLWLTEQPEVERAWVETVFGYDESPRNLCVVGIKKQDPS